MRFFQLAEMTECPRYLIAVSFKIAIALRRCSKHIGYVLGNTRFLGNTYNHICLFFFWKCKINKFYIKEKYPFSSISFGINPLRMRHSCG